MQENIAVLFGGQSVEHDISIITASQVMAVLSNNYNVVPIYITKQGEWLSGEKLKELETFNKSNFIKDTVRVCFKTHSNQLLREKRQGVYKPICDIDVALIAMHGGIGENGSIQGFMETNGICYTGSDVLLSAVSMDKSICKALLNSYGFNTVPSVTIRKKDFERNTKEVTKNIKEKLGLNVIIKPCSLGSSIGITRCKKISDILDALELAFVYDDKVLVEKFIDKALELNCACLRYGGEYTASQVDVVERNDEFFTFKEKYLATNGKQVLHQSASDNAEIKEACQKLTVEVSEKLGLSGVYRIDYLYKGNSFFVNEINTIPGSMSLHLFKGETFSGGRLLQYMIEDAKKAFAEKSKLVTHFDSSVLKGISQINTSKVVAKKV